MTSVVFEAVRHLQKKYKEFGINAPDLHFVLGSGLGSALDTVKLPEGWSQVGEVSFGELPCLEAATVPGHRGVYRYFKHSKTGKALTFQLGRLHGYEGHPAHRAVLTVMCPRMAGSSRFVLTNAAGSLTVDFPVGSVMLMQDHVNLTGQNPLHGPIPEGPDGKILGPRFPDMSEAYNSEMRARMRDVFKDNGLVVNEGVYLGLLGPSFETPAEIRTFARWGLQAVGMSTVWEAIALKHSGATLAGMSFISNLGCGLDGKKLDHEEVLRESEKAAKGIVQSLFDYGHFELTGARR